MVVFLMWSVHHMAESVLIAVCLMMYDSSWLQMVCVATPAGWWGLFLVECTVWKQPSVVLESWPGTVNPAKRSVPAHGFGAVSSRLELAIVPWELLLEPVCPQVISISLLPQLALCGRSADHLPPLRRHVYAVEHCSPAAKIAKAFPFTAGLWICYDAYLAKDW